jgi:DNA-binding LacI/PurR family transcriptional regulator
METRRPSMRDVARVAGLSLQTVSRVANGEPNVNADTRDRVLGVMRDIGYRPNLAARAMRRGSF